MLSVHGIILLCSIINIVICILQHKLFVFPFSYSFFNIPFYRYISSSRAIDFFVLMVLLVALVSAGAGEGTAAAAAIGGVVLYYGVLYLLRDKIRKKIKFTITKQTK